MHLAGVLRPRLRDRSQCAAWVAGAGSEPAPSAIKTATAKNQYDDQDDQKRGRIHGSLLGKTMPSDAGRFLCLCTSSMMTKGSFFGSSRLGVRKARGKTALPTILPLLLLIGAKPVGCAIDRVLAS